MPLGLSGAVENKNAWQICSDKQAFANLKETTLSHAASEHQICRSVSSSPLDGGRYMCDLRELPGAPCAQPPFPGSSQLTSALTTQLWLPGSGALCQPARSSEFFFLSCFLKPSSALPPSYATCLSACVFIQEFQLLCQSLPNNWLERNAASCWSALLGVDVHLHLDLHFPVTDCSTLVISPEQR